MNGERSTSRQLKLYTTLLCARDAPMQRWKRGRPRLFSRAGPDPPGEDGAAEVFRRAPQGPQNHKSQNRHQDRVSKHQREVNIMKTSRNKSSGRFTRALVALLALGLGLTGLSATASANTGAGTVILNVAQVDYQDASGTTSYSATSSASVTVQLVAAPPSITTPADQTVGSGTAATYTYTVTATTNGSDTYDLAAAFTATANLDGAETAVPSAATVTLGASVITAQPAADQIVIPAGSGANLALNDIIVIGGVDYQISNITVGTVASHTNNTAATTTVGVTTAEVPITITVIANAAGSNLPPAFAGAEVGTVAGEQQSFTVDITGTTAAAGDGTGTVDVTVTSQTDNGQVATDTTTTTYQANFVSILKVVRNVTTAGAFGATAIGVPTNTLEYQITMTNTSAANATSVTLTDAVPAYTSYVANSTLLNGITVAGDGAVSPLVAGLVVDDDGARGAGVAATGIIGPGNSAVVLFRVTIQ